MVEQKKTVLTGLILVVYQHNVEYKKKRLFLIERNKKPKQNAQEKLSKLKFDLHILISTTLAFSILLFLTRFSKWKI